MFLFIKENLLIKSRRSILLQVEYIINIMTPSGGKKTMVPGMPEAISLKSVVGGDTSYYV
jgi:hypothetical protein